jgi:hypothetical protein
VTKLKWMLVSVHLEIVLFLMQDRCTVCVEHTIRSEIFVGCTRWIAKVTLVMWNLGFAHLEIVLVLVQDKCMVCCKHTIGLEIIFDTRSGTPRLQGASGCLFLSVWR